MNKSQKANAVFEAADKLVEAYRTVGENSKADLVEIAFAELPRDSASKLYDILKK